MSVPKPNALIGEFIEGVRANVDRSSLSIPGWVCANFQNPKRPSEPWSFKDHEFQVEILSAGDDVPSVCVEKCAQVGLTTLEIVSLLAFGALHDAMKVAYILPTAKFAQEFVQTRIDPILSDSPRVKALLADADSKSVKKIGSCFAVFRGTSGESQGISIDLDCIVVDEVNFCNQRILSTFASRMQHSDLKLYRQFSTPTLPGYGISPKVEAGSLGQYKCKCLHCNQWVYPSFFKDLAGEGLFTWLGSVEKGITDVRPDDIEHLSAFLAEHDEASFLAGSSLYLKCPKCLKSLEESLRQAARRSWVHESPSRFSSGQRSYKVKPFDLPKYNPTQGVLLSMKDYLYGDWVNFRMGLPYASAENSFMVDVIKLYCTVSPVPIEQVRDGAVRSLRGYGWGTRLFIGADLGKTNHVIIGAEVGGRLEILCACTVGIAELRAIYGEAHFGKWLKDTFTGCGAEKQVADSAPSYEPALYCATHLPIGRSFGAYYVVRGTGKPDIYTFKEDGQGVVNICRTEHFTELAAEANGGGIALPSGPTGIAVLSHLGNIKKVKTIDSRGNAVENWESTGDDHYAHALGYCWAAYASVAKRGSGTTVSAPVGMGKIKMK
jgi:hypothetical protein